MNTHRPANITRVRNLVAAVKKKGFDLTFDQGVLTLRDPAGRESTAEIHSAPRMSGQRHLEKLVATAFQDYIMNVLAPGAVTRVCGHYWRRAHAWHSGAYECGASISYFGDKVDIFIVVTGDRFELENSYLLGLNSGSCSASFVNWPSPAEIQRLHQLAIAQFGRFVRFQAYLNKLGVRFDLERGSVMLRPVTVSFENTIGIGFERHRDTPLLEKSRQQIELIETFIKEDAKSMLALKVPTLPASGTDLESNLDLV
jgi:hypothetical protein